MWLRLGLSWKQGQINGDGTLGCRLSDERNRMAINPMVIFVGLSAAAVGGIVYVNHVKTPLVDAPVASENRQTIPLPEPVVKKPEKVASLPPKQVKPASVPAAPAAAKKPTSDAPGDGNSAVKTPPPPMPDLSEPTAIVPTFDVVRIEKDGGAVVVGKAAPDVTVNLLLNGKPFGTARSNAKGDWVFIPDKLIPAGDHQLMLKAPGGKNGELLRSRQTIVIAVAKKKQTKPLVVVASNDAPTKVLQTPSATMPAAPSAKSVARPRPPASGGQKVASKPPAKTPDAKAAVAPAGNASQVVEKNPAQTDSAPAQKTVTSKSTTPRTAGDMIRKQEGSTSKKVGTQALTGKREPEPPATPKALKKAPTPPQPTPLAKSAAKSAVPQPRPPVSQKLAFGTVDYNDSGDMVFSGSATANKKIRLYIDNKFVGETKSDPAGKWVFSGHRAIRPGVHQLRADLVTQAGSVARRAAVPFVRADPVKVAALLKTREKPKPAEKKTEAPALSAAPPATPRGKVSTAPKKPIAATQPARTTTTASRGRNDNANRRTPPKIVATAPPPGKTDNQLPPRAVGSATVPAAPVARQKTAPQAKGAARTPPVEKTVDTGTPARQPSAQPAVEQAVEKVAKAPGVQETAPSNPSAKTTPLVSHVVIQPGNNLWNISRVIYGKGVAYTTIFEANKEQIKDPDRIYPGQIFDTPGATSSGSISPDLREPETGAAQ